MVLCAFAVRVVLLPYVRQNPQVKNLKQNGFLGVFCGPDAVSLVFFSGPF